VAEVYFDLGLENYNTVIHVGLYERDCVVAACCCYCCYHCTLSLQYS